eukprot:jgi/Bigna1/147093/aug1.128_g21801
MQSQKMVDALSIVIEMFDFLKIPASYVHASACAFTTFGMMMLVVVIRWCTTAEKDSMKQGPKSSRFSFSEESPGKKLWCPVSSLLLLAISVFGLNVGTAVALCIGSQSILQEERKRPNGNILKLGEKKLNGQQNGETKSSESKHSGTTVVAGRKSLDVRRPYKFPPKGEKDEKMGGKEVNLIDEFFKPDMGILMDWIDDDNLKSDYEFKKDPYGEVISLSYSPPNIFCFFELSQGDDAGGFKPYMQFGNLTEKTEDIEKCTGVYMMRKRPVFCRYARYIPTLRQRMSLQEFPFDVINLDTEIQFGWTTNDLKIVAAEMEIDPKLDAMNEYVLVSHEMIVRTHLYEYYTAYEDSEDPYPEIIVRLTLARNPWYYIMRLVMPQILLSIMELTSFMCECDAIADRFSISGTIVLSEIALYFIAVDMLPKVPFSWCFMLVFISCVQNGINYMLHGSVAPELLQKIDVLSAIGYMLGVFLVTAWFMFPLFTFERYAAEANKKKLARKQHS